MTAVDNGRLKVNNVRLNHALRGAAILAIALPLVLGASLRVDAQNPTDPWVHPYASSSIWNTPISQSAALLPANLSYSASTYLSLDDEFLVRLNGDDPLRTMNSPAAWGPGRCGTGGTSVFEQHVNFPDRFQVADATSSSTPNNVASFLMPNGKTVQGVFSLTRCHVAGNVYGWVENYINWFPASDPYQNGDLTLYGDGLSDGKLQSNGLPVGAGGHDGTGIGALGGSIRYGELFGPQPITHALKIELYDAMFLSYNKTSQFPNYGCRWPASRCDSYAATRYATLAPQTTNPNPGMRAGALLALPASFNIAALKTLPAQKIAQALMTYGAYDCDDTSWDAYQFCLDDPVVTEFKAHMGYDVWCGPGSFQNAAQQDWYNDVKQIILALNLVNSNVAGSPGGGGAPRKGAYPYASPTASTPFFENFEIYPSGFVPDPSRWKIYSGTWLVNTDASQDLSKTDSASGMASAGDPNLTDYTVSGDVLLGTSGTTASVLGRVQGPTNSVSPNYYALGITTRSWSLNKVVDGISTTLSSGVSAYAVNTWYRLRIEMTGSGLIASLSSNGGATWAQLTSVSDTAITHGKIGCSATSTAKFDNLRVDAGTVSPSGAAIYDTMSGSAPGTRQAQLRLRNTRSRGEQQ